MGVGYERMMQVQEKDEAIICKITELTKGHQIMWEEVPGKQRTYRTEHKGMQIELRACGYMLEIDSHVIDGRAGDISPQLFEELDSSIQYWLRPHPGVSSRSGPLERAGEILERLNN